MSQTGNTSDLNKALIEMSKQENMEALLRIIDRLPEISKAIKSLEELSVFTLATLNDKQSIGELVENAEAQARTLGLSKDTAEALISLTQMLPQIVLLLKNTTVGIEFISGVLKDQESVQFLMKEIEPAAEKVKGIAGLFAETNRRCAEDTELPSLSIFKVVSLLKDENVRKGYKYLQTFLSVVSEKNSRRN